jgi:lipopolysaccharide export system permease protein
VLIFRYLAKEIFITLVSLTGILLLIFMSNQFVRYLSRAASGQIPGMVILKLMMLELPNLLGLLLPLGFYVAILIAYGRMYAESEMTVLHACGYGQSRLLKQTMTMASLVFLLVLSVMLFLSPYINQERTKLLKSTGIQTLIQTIMPGRFQAFHGGKEVFYVESISRDHDEANHIFLAKQSKSNPGSWDIMWAKDAHAQTDVENGEEYVILNEGKEYEGKPGRADYRVVHFGQYRARLPHPTVNLQQDIRTEPTANLLPYNNPNLNKAAELQWRLSVPLMVLILTLIAIPLSQVNPRSGKFARLMPAILIYVVYANFMFIARDWLKAGKVPVWVGMNWLHVVFLILAGLLLWQSKVKRL